MKSMPDLIASVRLSISAMLMTFILLSAPAWAAPAHVASSSAAAVSENRSVPTWIFVAQSQSIDENLREWESLSPEEKEQLRRRMQQLNRMEPDDRRHFQRLFEKWQQLTPEERRQIEQALDQWDRLSPAEKEAVRRRFRG